jgi:hypothetical protein
MHAFLFRVKYYFSNLDHCLWSLDRSSHNKPNLKKFMQLKLLHWQTEIDNLKVVSNCRLGL